LMVGLGSSTSFQAQAAHVRFSPNSGRIAASHRSATKSAAEGRGTADDGTAVRSAPAAPDKAGPWARG
jgi:hypothetical protein